jgi:alpha-galactosidase
MKAECVSIKAASCLLLLAVVLGGSGPAIGQTAQGSLAEQFPSVIAKAVTTVPFSFVYDGKPSRELLPGWEQKQVKQTLSGNRERRVVTYRDPHTGLEIIDEITVYKSLQAVDWVLRLRNTGSGDTPIIENLRALDLGFDASGSDDILLHQASGSAMNHLLEDFLPVEDKVAPGGAFTLVHYEMKDGEHVGGELPYFDVQWQDGGVIGAIGWSGQWEVQVSRSSGRELSLQAGQQGIHLKLHPMESIRTPSILLVQWDGKDRVLGHNQLRRLLVAHYLPRTGGQVAMPPVAATTGYVLQFEDIAKKTGSNPLEVMPNLKETDLGTRFIDQTPALNWVTEENQLDYIHKMPPGIEAYWLDAGWFEGGHPYGVGNPDPDPKKFPRGMKPLGDAAHQRGMKFLLWFEPERVSHGTLIEKQHPDWVLHIANEDRIGGRFNFGNPMALQWMTDLLSRQIDEWGIDIYRNDNNICPLPFWRTADAPDRQGITENHDIEGLYAMWDALLKRHPKLEIDNANWRITGPDIEAMKRTIGSLTRSESCGAGLPHPVSDQVQTAELSLWIPLHTNLLHALTPYSARSTITGGVGVGLDLRSDYIPRDQLEKIIEQVKELRPFWLGDYYPLAEINFDETAWCAWQFDRPDLKAGFGIFLRRPRSEQSIFESTLRGLDLKGTYEVTFAETFDVKEKRVMSGAALGHLRVEIGSAPGVMLVRYRKIKGS